MILTSRTYEKCYFFFSSSQVPIRLSREHAMDDSQRARPLPVLPLRLPRGEQGTGRKPPECLIANWSTYLTRQSAARLAGESRRAVERARLTSTCNGPASSAVDPAGIRFKTKLLFHARCAQIDLTSSRIRLQYVVCLHFQNPSHPEFPNVVRSFHGVIPGISKRDSVSNTRTAPSPRAPRYGTARRSRCLVAVVGTIEKIGILGNPLQYFQS